MKRYRNLAGDSGVVAYECRDGAILVEFTDGSQYLYDEHSTGSAEIAEMQRLAAAGRGLSTYISRVVRDAYAQRWR